MGRLMTRREKTAVYVACVFLLSGAGALGQAAWEVHDALKTERDRLAANVSDAARRARECGELLVTCDGRLSRVWDAFERLRKECAEYP
jgi:hypothetical protein